MTKGIKPKFPSFAHPTDSNLKHYVVTLKSHDDLADFYNDMETEGGSVTIPNRKVEVKQRLKYSRNTHYWLTKEEKDTLLNDSRVAYVDLTPQEKGFWPDTDAWVQTSDRWSKAVASRGDDLNWGIPRSLAETNYSNWGAGGNHTITETCKSELSGKNVDVVVMDDYDPISTTLEFSENVDGTGPSRMLHHDWHNDGVNSFERMNGNSATHGGPDGNRQPGTYNGITPVPSGTVTGTGLKIDVTVGNDGDTGWYYSGSGSIGISYSGGQPNEGEGYNVGDTFTILDTQLGSGGGADITLVISSLTSYGYEGNNEHGAHTTGTTAGNTVGWARDARIFNLTYGDQPSLVLNWHNNKPINPVTGVKNPTVMNNSWGYRGPGWIQLKSTCKRINHRGTDYFPHPNGGVYSPGNITGQTDATRPNGIQDNILASSTTSANGTGAQFRFETTAGGVTGITVASGNDDGSKYGSGYVVGDTLTFNASLFGGTQDIVCTLTNVGDDGTNGRALWTNDTLDTVAMGTGSLPTHDFATDADFTDLVNAGVIVVASAGNSDFYIARQGDQDWDNYFEDNNGNINYYHRGSSPGSTNDEIITVGAMGSHDEPAGESIYNSTAIEQQDYKAEFSNFGPGVEVWMAGSGIQSVWKTDEALYDSINTPDPRLAALGMPPDSHNNMKKCPGTSMSGPNVAGVLACLAEKYPKMTQADALKYIIDYCHETVAYTTGGVHTDDRDLGRAYSSLSNIRHMYLKKYRKVDSGGVSYPEPLSISRDAANSGQKYPRSVSRVSKSSSTFALSASPNEIKFDSPITISLTTTGVEDGTRVPWYITSDYKGAGVLTDGSGYMSDGYWERGLWAVKNSAPITDAASRITYFGNTARGERPSKKGSTYKITTVNESTAATVEHMPSYNWALQSLDAYSMSGWDTQKFYTVMEGGNDETGYYEWDLPWTVNIFGANHTKLYVHADSFIKFGNSLPEWDKNILGTPVPIFCFGTQATHEAWLCYGSTIGTAPNRSFVVRVWNGDSYPFKVNSFQLEFKENEPSSIYYTHLEDKLVYIENKQINPLTNQNFHVYGSPIGDDMTGEFVVQNNQATYTLHNKFTPSPITHNAYFKLQQFGGAYVSLLQKPGAIYKAKVTNHSTNGFTFSGTDTDWPGTDRYWSSSTTSPQNYRGWTTHLRVGDTWILRAETGNINWGTLKITDTYGSNVESGSVVDNNQISYTFRPTDPGEYWMSGSNNSGDNSYQRIIVDGLYKVQITAGNITNGYTSNGVDRRGTYTSTDDKEIHIRCNDTLIIENNAAAGHPVRISSVQGNTGPEHWEVSDNNQGQYTWTPTSPGKYWYNCVNHNGMEGTIIVSPPPTTYLSCKFLSSNSNSTNGYAFDGEDRRGEVSVSGYAFYAEAGGYNKTIYLNLGDVMQIQDETYASDPVIISETNGGPVSRDVISNWSGNRWFKPSKVQTYYYYSSNNPSTMAGTIEVTLP